MTGEEVDGARRTLLHTLLLITAERENFHWNGLQTDSHAEDCGAKPERRRRPPHPAAVTTRTKTSPTTIQLLPLTAASLVLWVCRSIDRSLAVDAINERNYRYYICNVREYKQEMEKSVWELRSAACNYTATLSQDRPFKKILVYGSVWRWWVMMTGEWLAHRKTKVIRIIYRKVNSRGEMWIEFQLDLHNTQAASFTYQAMIHLPGN